METKVLTIIKDQAEECIAQEAMFGWNVCRCVDAEKVYYRQTCQIEFERTKDFERYDELCQLEERYQSSKSYTDYQMKVESWRLAGKDPKMWLYFFAFCAYLSVQIGLVVFKWAPAFAVICFAISVVLIYKIIKKKKEYKKVANLVDGRIHGSITISQLEIEDIIARAADCLKEK